jgi:DNA-binding response OmpR family regulator
MAKGYKLDADYYITKPFSKAQLIFEIKLMLGEISKETIEAYIEN